MRKRILDANYFLPVLYVWLSPLLLPLFCFTGVFTRCFYVVNLLQLLVADWVRCYRAKSRAKSLLAQSSL